MLEIYAREKMVILLKNTKIKIQIGTRPNQLSNKNVVHKKREYSLL